MLTFDIVCHRPHHEVPQEDEARPACPRNPHAANIPLQPQTFRHQEGDRPARREGVLGTSG